MRSATRLETGRGEVQPEGEKPTGAKQSRQERQAEGRTPRDWERRRKPGRRRESAGDCPPRQMPEKERQEGRHKIMPTSDRRKCRRDGAKLRRPLTGGKRPGNRQKIMPIARAWTEPPAAAAAAIHDDGAGEAARACQLKFQLASRKRRRDLCQEEKRRGRRERACLLCLRLEELRPDRRQRLTRQPWTPTAAAAAIHAARSQPHPGAGQPEKLLPLRSTPQPGRQEGKRLYEKADTNGRRPKRPERL